MNLSVLNLTNGNWASCKNVIIIGERQKICLNLIELLSIPEDTGGMQAPVNVPSSLFTLAQKRVS